MDGMKSKDHRAAAEELSEVAARSWLMGEDEAARDALMDAQVHAMLALADAMKDVTRIIREAGIG